MNAGAQDASLLDDGGEFLAGRDAPVAMPGEARLAFAAVQAGEELGEEQVLTTMLPPL